MSNIGIYSTNELYMYLFMEQNIHLQWIEYTLSTVIR